jgi:5-methylcytosine-specific restriction endonuclease McrA
VSRTKQDVRRRFRSAVFERDGFACRVCRFAPKPERADSELDAHHITDRHEMPNGGYVAENGIALCSTCHLQAEAHHRGDPVPPGFTPAELYALVGSSAERALAASEALG